MGAFSNVRGAFQLLFNSKANKDTNKYFEMLDGYTPVFSTYDEGLYEMELCRACIHAFATHASKLQPNVTGADLRGYQRMLDNRPNPFMTGAQFLYKVATIHETKNTCFIVPILDKFDTVTGFYPVNPDTVEVLDVDGKPWLRYTFIGGKKAALPLAMCGVVSKYLYKNDIVGESNHALDHTIQLLNTQNQGISEGIKNSASFRFMATVDNFSKESDMKKERKKWVEDNLGPDSGGLALFPNRYTNIQQIQSHAQIVDPTQMQVIQERVFDYFGTNVDVLQNKTVGDTWSAYYEGKIEPFAIQLSQAMTTMAYTAQEIARENAIVWSANRMQYMNNTDKLQVSSQLFDRGILTTNQIMDIWNLPHVEDGDKRFIRKEYTEVSLLNNVPEEERPSEVDG